MAWRGWRAVTGMAARAAGVAALGGVLTLGALVCVPGARAQGRGEIRVKVVGLQSDRGALRFGLYDRKETFASEGGAIASGARPIKSGQCEFVIPDLPYGTYALIVAHDVNGDGKIDRNPFSPELKGITNYQGKVLWFPSFDKAKFRLDRPSVSVEIRVY
jgi:uncharacterized protein (DUF2141 family)